MSGTPAYNPDGTYKYTNGVQMNTDGAPLDKNAAAQQAAFQAAQQSANTQGVDGPPSYPKYRQQYHPGMSIAPGLRQDSANIGVGLRKEADRSGLSPVSRLRMSLADQQVASQGAQARGQMASSGGLRAGQSMAVENQTGRNALDVRQQLAIADEQNRLTAMGAADQTQMERLKMLANAQNIDVNREVQNNQMETQFDLDRYGHNANLYGAMMQANATAQSGKNGIF